ncbi:MAG: hypothetical protein BGO55_05880 [Sphingobacteriales bacterium 50-39]|mgnify:CR=1 FL=1|nr:hypothetical protein [Sphingobacteriales bacterium]OJW56118.1 MAG: hypothetical protein BGO55_05880 [Sphingobacteriales bacterium 50-39]
MKPKLKALLILFIIVLALIPIYYINRVLKRTIRPRESTERFFLFIFANFFLVVVYTMTVVAIVVRLFPAK